MASSVAAAFCAVIATAFWTFLGNALARRLLPRVLALGAAPVLGWAVHSAVALPILRLAGFSPLAVAGLGAICIAGAALGFSASVPASGAERAPTIPSWAFAAAAILALAPAAAVLPKFSGDAVALADPIFDHSKIAIIDAMTRQGLPPVNPVFGEPGAPNRLAYYYLWHFSAAELALILGARGWEADIGLTWFTAFASLSLMMGLAVWLAKRPAAAIFVALLAIAGSLWWPLYQVFGYDALTPVLWPPIGMGGWLFQATWVPQHLMAASCTITAMLLVIRYVEQQSPALLLTLALVIVAGFESSTFVGGVTFALAALAAAPFLFIAIDPARRLRVAAAMIVAIAVVACFVAPFVFDQLATVKARGDGAPIVIDHYAVLGELFPRPLRRVLDLPAYWLILLPIELPATYLAGILALSVALRSTKPKFERLIWAVFACLTAAGLAISWLLFSTLGENNDLGLRAIIPAEMILIVSAAAGITFAPRRLAIVATALGGLVLSLPSAGELVLGNLLGKPQPDGSVFAQAPQLWEAVRHYAAPDARVADNPLYLQDLTPWPANMSWALLANRGSCFAGREVALAFAPLPPQRRDEINTQFVRVFDGEGTAADVHEMATTYGCDVVVVVPQDKAWNADPFAASVDYRLAENRDGRWRIYVRATDVKSPRTN